MLHGWRRGRVRRRLARRPPPRAILFVCHGNICRSPYAAAVARQVLGPAVAIDSAGFIGPDRPSPPEAAAVARERGVDLGAHRSQLVADPLVAAAGLIVVMDPAQRRRIVRRSPGSRGSVVLLGDLDPEPITRRAIPDPVDRPPEVFRSTFDRIERCVQDLASLWGHEAQRGTDE